MTFPKTVCLLSSHGHLTVVMKNWEPLVFGPQLAIERTYGWNVLNRDGIHLQIHLPNGFTTSPVTLWITGLNHEIFDDSMEDDIVIVAVLAMSHEIFNSLWSFISVSWRVMSPLKYAK